jgi:predicted small lipoprotein YifL
MKSTEYPWQVAQPEDEKPQQPVPAKDDPATFEWQR